MMRFIAEKMEAGGFFMWPILFLWAIGVAIVIERFKVLMSAGAIKKDDILDHVNAYVLQGNIEKAVALVAQTKNPLTFIVKAGLVTVLNGGDAEEVQTAMDSVALKEIPLLEKRLGLLAMIGNLATLLGLLGTVSGMIGAFHAVARVAPAEKAAILAGSISEALNCTAFGLITAIPMLGAFGYLSAKAQDIVDGIHEAAVSTLNFILSNKDRVRVKNG